MFADAGEQFELGYREPERGIGGTRGPAHRSPQPGHDVGQLGADLFLSGWSRGRGLHRLRVPVTADSWINSGHAGRGAGHGVPDPPDCMEVRVVRAPWMEWFGVSGAAARLEYAGKAPGRMAADGGWTGPWMPVKRAGAKGTTMQELRFVAVSEDGRYAVLAVPGRSARFTLPIDERLRAVALGQTSRLVQYEIEVESPLRPKEIQARIRAGETVEEIADAAGIAVERVRWFEGPVLAERAYAAEQAQRASVRRLGDAAPSTPGPSLGEIVTERLKMFGSDPEDAQWDAKKRGDGSWQVQLTFMSGGRLHVAEWVFDPRRRHVLPADDTAARISLPGGELPQPAEPPPGEAAVTQLAPRLSSAAGQGYGQSGTGTSGFAPVGSGHGGS